MIRSLLGNSFDPLSEAPATIGSFYAGGYYAGRILLNSSVYAIIVSPKALGSSLLQWKTTQTLSSVSSTNDGWANTNAINDASHPAAQFTRGLTINGYSDWYMPAKDELELMYRNLKPDATANHTSSGANSSSIPTGSAYSSSIPTTTTASLFVLGGSEAFSTDWHWSSTEYASSPTLYAGAQRMLYTGEQGGYGKDSVGIVAVRAVRRQLL